MKITLARLLLMCLLSISTTAMAAPASDAAIRRLLAVTETRKMLTDVDSQFQGMMNQAIQEGLQGKVPTARQQEAIDGMKRRMTGLLQEEMAWERLEPFYLRLYRESFTEEEVSGMVAFYETPTGRAVVRKMPVLMQNTMAEMQRRILGLLPKIQKIQEQFMQEMSAGGP